MLVAWVMGAAGLGGCQRPASQHTADTPPSTSASGAPAEITASVDRAEATTGDVITYAVEIDHAAGVAVDLQEPGASIAGLRILDAGRDPPVAVGTRVRERRWYKIRADLVGSYVLPPVQATYRTEGQPGADTQPLQSSEIFIEVKSVLPSDGEAQDIRDLDPIEPVHRSLRWVWLTAAAGLILAAAGLGIWWWQRRRAAHAEAPALPPHEAAFMALNRLRKTDFADHEAVRAYYFGISEIMRTYLEGRFGFNATDLTTEEIFARLPDVTGLDAPLRQSLREFLTGTDSVKFAGIVPDNTHIAHTYEQALSFVEATQPITTLPDATTAAAAS